MTMMLTMLVSRTGSLRMMSSLMATMPDHGSDYVLVGSGGELSVWMAIAVEVKQMMMTTVEMRRTRRRMIIVCSRIALLEWARGTATVAEAQLSWTESFSLPIEGLHVSQDVRTRGLP